VGGAAFQIRSEGGAATCAECTTVVARISDFITNANETVAGQAVDYLSQHVCATLPPTAAQEACQAVVRRDVPLAWASLVQGLVHPLSACTHLELCGAQPRPSLTPAELCRICTQASSVVNAAFSSPDAKRAAVSSLQGLCAELPAGTDAAVEAQCEQSVEDDAPLMMQLIGQSIESSLCQQVGMCGKSA